MFDAKHVVKELLANSPQSNVENLVNILSILSIHIVPESELGWRLETAGKELYYGDIRNKLTQIINELNNYA